MVNKEDTYNIIKLVEKKVEGKMKKTRCPKNTTVLLLCYVVVILSAQVSMALSLRLSKILQKNDEQKVEKEDEQAQDWLVYYFIIIFYQWSYKLDTSVNLYCISSDLFVSPDICLRTYTRIYTSVNKIIFLCRDSLIIPLSRAK